MRVNSRGYSSKSDWITFMKLKMELSFNLNKNEFKETQKSKTKRNKKLQISNKI